MAIEKQRHHNLIVDKPPDEGDVPVFAHPNKVKEENV